MAFGVIGPVREDMRAAFAGSQGVAIARWSSAKSAVTVLPVGVKGIRLSDGAEVTGNGIDVIDDLPSVDGAGKALPIGSFGSIPSTSVPASAELIQASGATRGLMIADATLTDADVALFPALIKKTKNGRFFRRDPTYLETRQLGVDLEGAINASPLIQQGIDYLQRFKGTFGQFYNLYFTPGQHRIENTIVRKSCSLISTGGTMATGPILYWAGADGGTILREDSTLNYGNLSFGRIYGLWLDGAGIADFGYDMRPNLNVIDVGFRLDEIYFTNFRERSIWLKDWINLHWGHLRFDSPGKFAMEAVLPADRSASSFVIDKFTYDNQVVNHPGKPSYGFFKLKAVGGAHKGIIRFGDARLELNGAWTTGIEDGREVGKSLVELDNSQEYFNVSLAFDNLSIATDAASAPAGPYGIVRNYGPSSPQPVAISCGRLAFTHSESWRWVTGNVNDGQVNPPVPSRAHMVSLDNTFGEGRSLFSNLFTYARTSLQVVLRHYLGAETAPRFGLRGDGFLLFGNGTVDPPNFSLGYNADGLLLSNSNVVARYVSPPASMTSAGSPGERAISGNVEYVCTAQNTWRALDLRTF